MDGIGQDNLKETGTANDIEKIYNSVGEISAKIKEVIWSLNTENDNLTNLLSYIQKQVRLWLEHYPCKLAINIPDIIPDLQISGESRRNIFLIVKEAVHNIIKHSEADKVVIKMDCDNEQLVITISDNGKGINDEQSNSGGNGMKNIRQRIEKLNGKFIITNKEGLTLIAKIPL